MAQGLYESVFCPRTYWDAGELLEFSGFLGGMPFARAEIPPF